MSARAPRAWLMLAFVLSGGAGLIHEVVWARRLGHLFGASFAVFSVLRFIVAFLILLGPTVMMGATLPVLADELAALEGGSVHPEWVYTANIIGAVLGVIAGGFILMPALGVWSTTIVAAAINVAVGVGVLAT